MVARTGADLPGAELAWTPGWLGTISLALAVLAACYAVRLLLPAKHDAGSDAEADGDLTGQQLDAPFASGPTPVPVPVLPSPLRRRVRVLVAALLVLGFLLLLLRPAPLVRIATGWPPTGARLVMCSVGQGDLLVLPVTGGPGDDSSDTAVVVDTGPDPAAADACLRDLGITRVPMVLLTHFHADHSEGLPGVLRNRSVGAIETTTVATPPGEVAKVTRWAAEAGVPVLRAMPGSTVRRGPSCPGMCCGRSASWARRLRGPTTRALRCWSRPAACAWHCSATSNRPPRPNCSAGRTRDRSTSSRWPTTARPTRTGTWPEPCDRASR